MLDIREDSWDSWSDNHNLALPFDTLHTQTLSQAQKAVCLHSCPYHEAYMGKFLKRIKIVSHLPKCPPIPLRRYAKFQPAWEKKFWCEMAQFEQSAPKRWNAGKTSLSLYQHSKSAWLSLHRLLERKNLGAQNGNKSRRLQNMSNSHLKRSFSYVQKEVHRLQSKPHGTCVASSFSTTSYIFLLRWVSRDTDIGL